MDITGDGIPEALIDTGDGGAYTDYLTLMRIEEGKPALARFKGMDGKVQAMSFAEGASAMNGEAVRILPEKHALYLGHWRMGPSGQRLGTCTVEAYQWNPHSDAFEYNRALSRGLKDGFCRSVIDALRSNMPR